MSDLPKQPPQFDSKQKPPPPGTTPSGRSNRLGGRARGRAGMNMSMATETRSSTQAGPFGSFAGSFGPVSMAEPHPTPHTLPPLTIPEPTFTRPVYQHPPHAVQSQGTRHPLPQDAAPPQPTQPRIESIINQASWTPPGSKSPYSPRYSAQASPSGPRTGQKRPFEPYQHEDARYRDPPLPSPGYTDYPDSWSSVPSQRGSAASSTGLGSTLPPPVSSSTSSILEPWSHRSSSQPFTGFPGPLQQPSSTSTPQQSILTPISHQSMSSLILHQPFMSSASPYPVPNTVIAPPTNTMHGRHRLLIRQQPVAARACGFGERDRRVIDPPPILQLLLKDFDPNSASDATELRNIFVVHAGLLSANDNDKDNTSSPFNDVTLMHEPYHRPSRRLMGTLVASPFVCSDPEPERVPTFHLARRATSTESATPQPNSISDLISGQISAPTMSSTPSPTTTTTTDPSLPQLPSTFFLFPDLSCRTPGHYRLFFRLVRITTDLTSTPGVSTPFIAESTSDVFEVFAAKDFPGMRASTKLTAGLKKAGAGIGLKKGASGKGGKGNESDEEAGGEEEVPAEDEGQGQWRKLVRKGKRKGLGKSA